MIASLASNLRGGLMGNVRGRPDRLHFRSSDPIGASYDNWAAYKQVRGGDFFDVVSNRDDLAGFTSSTPWPTFVLGSGCLTPLPPESLNDDGLDAALKSAFESFPAVDRLEGDLALTLTFVKALTAMKLEQTPAPTAWLVARSAAQDAFPWATTLRICLLAAIATRAYTALVSVETSVLGRADREGVTYVDGDPELGRVIRDFVMSMRQVAGRLRRPDIAGHGAAWRSFKTLLNALNAQVDGKYVLRRQHIELLAAFAWHFLTDGTEIYPGWSDILLFHAFESENNADFSKVPVPLRARRTAILGEESWMYRRLRRVTQRSIATPEPLFVQVASILTQQASLLSALVPQPVGRPAERLPLGMPHATALVTSFDVELEMALSSQASQFAIVIPVVGKDPGRPRAANAAIHWLYRVVSVARPERRDETLRLLLEAPDEWLRMPEDPALIPAELGRLPIVVHLAGAPLFSIPKLISGVGELTHALLLDETIAIMQFGAEVKRDGSDRLCGRLIDESDPPSNAQRGWPAPRFWTFVGNPQSDPAVRLRLLASGWNVFVDVDESADDHTTGNAALRRLRGVVLNRWVPAGESEAFRWQALDVVQGESSELAADLARYTQQIEGLLPSDSTPDDTQVVAHA